MEIKEETEVKEQGEEEDDNGMESRQKGGEERKGKRGEDWYYCLHLNFTWLMLRRTRTFSWLQTVILYLSTHLSKDNNAKHVHRVRDTGESLVG